MTPINFFTTVLKVTLVPLPWLLKRPLLQRLFGFQLDPSAQIGLAWVYPRQLRMAAGSRIADLSVVVNLDLV